MSSILRKPTTPSLEAPNRYIDLGLKDNPFPSEPSLVLDNKDPRLNGDIYNTSLHEEQRKKFDELLVPCPGRPDPRTLIFLMDHATKRGRGIGKTVFLKKQVDRIMKDLGDEASGGVAVILASHVVPNSATPARKFWQFARLIFDHLLDKDVIAIAVARIRALTGKIDPSLLSGIVTTEDLLDKLGNNSWLSDNRIPVDFELNPTVEHLLKSAGVRDEIAHALAFRGTDTEKLGEFFHSNWTDHRWRQDGGKMVFHDLVNLFVTAEFSRGLLLIDEVEKIIPHQNLLERRSFVEALRYFLFDGNCASAKRRFYGMLLTVHPGIQEAVLPHWNAAGLDRLSPINEPDAQRNTIYFGPLSQTDAKPLVVEYLQQYRLTPSTPTDLSPFDEDAIVEALVKSGAVPGRMLTFLHEIVEYAVSREVRNINKDFVIETFSQKERTEAPAIDDAAKLPAPETNLID